MHDVLVHYLEVNFAEIAEQMAHAQPGDQAGDQASDQGAAAERLRHLIRRLRGGATQTPTGEHPPEQAAAELTAALNGELTPPEHQVLEHFFELFARSMKRTQPQTAAPQVPEPEPEPEPEPAAPTAVQEPEPRQAAVETAPVQDAAVPKQPQSPAPEGVLPQAPVATQAPASRLVAEHMAGPLQTVLLAAAQQALDLLQVDASQVYTVDDQRRFILRAGVPTESLAAPEPGGTVSSAFLRRALEHNEVFTVEDLATEALTPDEAAWVDAGYHGFAAIALAPPLERPVGVLALLRRTPWRLDRRDAVRLEDLAAEAVAALRAHSLAIKVEEVAVLQERLNLAREIHDGLASDLAAVVALFKYYEQRRERDPEDAAQLLPQLRSMTEEILAGARNILQSLRPKTIRSEGLMASTIKAVDHFGRVNLVETSVDLRGEENGLSPEHKEVIFQVLRESLSNIRKHSQARNVSVTLDLSTVPWVMRVGDDGRGFDVRRVAEDPRKAGSYGLVGMRERAELLGGNLEIVSQVNEGTIVTLIGPPDLL
ncbi:MAG: histidine kinase [Candidatus Dormibacteraeota bacterium]|nr:histidine kinase [Candidatus Dormibacteraeota bacterium]